MSGYAKLLSAAQQVTQDVPAPTKTPAPVLVRDAEARAKRQATTSVSTTFTVTKAPDATCGFLSGSAGVAITCENKKTCLWETQYIGAIFCGFGTDDPAYLRCFPREAALNTASCNDVCQSNTFNLLCTNTASPYCRTYAYPGGVKDFRCAATPVDTPQTVLYTYNNQDDRTFTVSQVGGSVLGFIPSAATNSATTSRSRTTTSSDDTSSTGSGGTTTTTVPPSSPPANSSGSSAPVGAIVGGVVGGLAVLGLLVLGIFFLVRRNKKNATDPPTPAPAPPANPQYYNSPPHPQMQQTSQQPYAPSESLGPVSPTSTYDPVYAMKAGHGSVSMASAVTPSQDDYNRMSYAQTPPVYQQPGGSPPPQQGYQGSPSPPVGGYQQPPGQGVPASMVYGGGQQGGYGGVQPGYGGQQQVSYGGQVHEIGTVPDQHRGQVHEAPGN